MDVAWDILVIAGVEKARLVQGAVGFAGVRLDFKPYTHSLLAALALGVAVWLCCYYGRFLPSVLYAGPMLAAVVASHWLFDALVHRPDLPLYDSKFFFGSGLWDHSALTSLILEEGVFAGALTVYWWWGDGRTGRGSKQLVMFGLVLLGIQGVMGSLPLRRSFPFALFSSDAVAASWLAASGLLFYAGCAWWVNRLESRKELEGNYAGTKTRVVSSDAERLSD
jgi:hypothetical protein